MMTIRAAPAPNPAKEPLAAVYSKNTSEMNSTTDHKRRHLGIHMPLIAMSAVIAAYRPTPVPRMRPEVRSNQSDARQSRNSDGSLTLSMKSNLKTATANSTTQARITASQVAFTRGRSCSRGFALQTTPQRTIGTDR